MCRYERVRDLEIGMLRTLHKDVGEALSTVSERLVQGELPHAGEILKKVFDIKLSNTSIYATQMSGGSTASGTTKNIESVKSGWSLKQTARRGQGGQPFRGNVAPPPFRSFPQSYFADNTSTIPSGSPWTTFNPTVFEDDDV